MTSNGKRVLLALVWWLAGCASSSGQAACAAAGGYCTFAAECRGTQGPQNCDPTGAVCCHRCGTPDAGC